MPSLVAVIVTEPAATAVTRPLELTLAVVALDELHVIDLPVRVLPDASFVTAES